MARVEDKYIVSKGNQWLKQVRRDLLPLPMSYGFSTSTYDAKQFKTRQEAKRLARKIGGEIWLFNPATGARNRVINQIPPGAKCDDCKGYTPYDGICRSPDSEFYREPVSMEDVCDEWRGKR